MTDQEREFYWKLAMLAHKEARFEDEAALWKLILDNSSRRVDVLFNLATAKMNGGHYQEALTLFNETLLRDPKLSRAHNNRAKLKLLQGADVGDLVPEFLLAVQLSQSTKEFCWHAINLCQSVTFGSNTGGEELLDDIEKKFHKIIDERFEVSLRQKQHDFFSVFVCAYRHIAQYRKAFSSKKWSLSEASLLQACDAFSRAGVENFAQGTRDTLDDYFVFKDVFVLLEDIGADQRLSATDALNCLLHLRKRMSSTRSSRPGSFDKRCFDIFNAFTEIFAEQLKYISHPVESTFQDINEGTHSLLWLTSSSFRQIGDDFLGIINFAERIRSDLERQISALASNVAKERASDDCWQKLALYVNARVLDFAYIDVTLARAALGRAPDPLGRVRAEIQEFRSYVERQAHVDMYVDGKPKENIGRALLQASLSRRSYREVPVRGGRSDLLSFEAEGKRILIETKIWRGAENYEQGIRELSQYIIGEGDDESLLGSFYVIFDPTYAVRATDYLGSSLATFIGEEKRRIEVIVININLPIPSKAK